jgi:hypothetical protein
MRMSTPVARDLVWEERRKLGGVRAVAYAGPSSSLTRFGAGLLFVVSSLAFVWIGRRFVKEYPPWVNVVLGGLAIAGLAVAALSAPGSAHGRIEISQAKLRFVSRGVFAPDVDIAIANVVSFSADTNAEGRYRVYAFMRNNVRVQLATFATLGAANEMVSELDQLLDSLRVPA